MRTMARKDDDLDVLSKRVQESEQPLRGKALQLSAHEIRDISLGDTEHISRLRLSQATPFDDTRDARCDLGLSQGLSTLGDAEILKDIA